MRPNVKNKNGGLDLYGAEPFEQQQFGTAGVEGVNTTYIITYHWRTLEGTVLCWVQRAVNCF